MVARRSRKPDIQDSLGALIFGELTINALSEEAAKLKAAGKMKKAQAALKKIAEIRAHMQALEDEVRREKDPEHGPRKTH